MAAAKTKKKVTYAPIVAAIMSGEHDANLDMIERAAAWRKKKVASESGIRKYAKVRLKHDARNKQYRGREGRVVKLNKNTITIDLECEQCGKDVAVPDATPWEDRCTACHGIPGGVNVPHDLLEAVKP